jgi:molybdopterin adenylyltransferase
MTAAAVITVSDSSSRGQRADLSGPAVATELATHGFDVRLRLLVADEQKAIEDALRAAAKEVPLVITTGGTGISGRDVTPEATRAVCGRLLEGVAEVMRAEGRKETPYAALSRAVCGTVSVNEPPQVVALPSSDALSSIDASPGSHSASGAAHHAEALVLNLPGSPRGAVTSLRVAMPLVKHALELLAGHLEHSPHQKPSEGSS